MELRTIQIEKPEDLNFILGHSHFIKTVEDLHEALVQAGAASSTPEPAHPEGPREGEVVTGGSSAAAYGRPPQAPPAPRGSPRGAPTAPTTPRHAAAGQ